MVRTQGFHPCNTGSIPVGASNGSFVQRLVYLTVYQRIGVRFPYGPPYEV